MDLREKNAQANNLQTFFLIFFARQALDDRSPATPLSPIAEIIFLFFCYPASISGHYRCENEPDSAADMSITNANSVPVPNIHQSIPITMSSVSASRPLMFAVSTAHTITDRRDIPGSKTRPSPKREYLFLHSATWKCGF